MKKNIISILLFVLGVSFALNINGQNITLPSSEQTGQIHAFSNELPSEQTYEQNFSFNTRAGSDDNLDDDPNGQGPGIGTLPLGNGITSALSFVVLYGLFTVYRKVNKRIYRN